jgi:phosphoenolpyruvate carboxykinase (ATP)
MLDAALSGAIEREKFHHDNLFHLDIPENCPGVPSEILFPGNTWPDKKAYERQAGKLAQKFSKAFNKNYGDKIRENIRRQCPGK